MKLPISDLQDAIAQTIADAEPAYDVAALCEFFGLEPQRNDNPFNSKRKYVLSRLKTKSLEFLIDLGHQVNDRYHSDELALVLKKFTSDGVSGEVKNIIFAAKGEKPEIVLTDAVNNTISIVKHAELCLVYDKPITSRGLLWSELVLWWKEKCACRDETAQESLYNRLKESMDCDGVKNEVELFLFRVYYKQFYPQLGEKLPALIPQVYLHYDPKTLKELRGMRRIPRERMDFLLLFSDKDRVVLEIDGKHHYSKGDTACPEEYAKMVAEDRRLRLLGYEVYRFGGFEFVNKTTAYKTLTDFFWKLFEKHGILLS